MAKFPRGQMRFPRCRAFTKDGHQCTQRAHPGSLIELCLPHRDFGESVLAPGGKVIVRKGRFLFREGETR